MCVCVFFGRVGPNGRASRNDDLFNFFPLHSDPGEGEGVPENQQQKEQLKKGKRKEHKSEKHNFLKCVAISSKIRGLSGLAFTVAL